MWTNRIFYYLIFTLIIVISFFHIFKIDQIGKGLYVDESSIGLNAVTISRTLRDEYGVLMPLYFRAFGEYKNPVYIYLTALIFKLAGISVFNLRITSYLFYITALFFSLALIYKLFNKDRLIFIYFVLSLGFLPIYFTASRTSYEVISQLTFMSAFLYFLYIGYVSENSKERWKFSLLSGCALGLSIYTYTTSRLLSFLFLVATILIFKKRVNIKIFLLGFVACVIPFFVYFFIHPKNIITPRFLRITSANTVTINPLNRLKQISIDYIKSLSPVYLIIKGDPNLRHTTPYAGIIFKTNYILLLLSTFFLIKDIKKVDKFKAFLIISILLSSLCAPITGEPYQSFRNFLVGFFITLFSCYGLLEIQRIKIPWLKLFLVICVFAALGGEIIYFQYNYFTKYPEISVTAFESSGYVEAFRTAHSQNPTKIIISEKTNQPYIHYRFYDQIENLDQKVKVEIGPLKPQIGACILFIPENKPKLDSLSVNYKYKDFTQKDWFYTVRCY
jgi:hypothetical protein